MKSKEFNTPCGFKITMAVGAQGQLIIYRQFEGKIISFEDSRYVISDNGQAMINDQLRQLYAWS